MLVAFCESMFARFKMLDVHAHLDSDELADNYVHMLRQASRHGVQAIIGVSESYDSARRLLALSAAAAATKPESSPSIYSCIGLHPCQVSALGSEAAHAELDMLTSLLRNCRQPGSPSFRHVVGIGECGLDFSPWIVKSDADKQLQRDIFGRQIELAKELKLPLNVHSRNAGHHAISMLQDAVGVQAVLHAFDGRISFAVNACKQDDQNGMLPRRFYFSIPPIICRESQFLKLATSLPLDALLLESDAPALAPEKGAVNVPANVGRALQTIAAARPEAVADIASKLFENARHLFQLADICQ